MRVKELLPFIDEQQEMVIRAIEVNSPSRTDQKVLIYCDEYHIYGRIYDIIDTEEYRENRIGDMIVIKILAHENELQIMAWAV